MIFFLIAIFIVALYKIKYVGQGFNEEALSIEQTTAINGIFALLIFISHSVQYFEISGPLDDPYFAFRSVILQLVVVTFLFYSGYGIMVSILKKGNSYVKSFPKNRILKVWLMFAIATTCFLIAGLAIGKKFKFTQLLLAYTAYSSIGNSNWYIFVVLILYVFTYVAFMAVKEKPLLAICLTFVITAIYIYLAAYVFGMPSRFYNTCIMYPVGMLYAYFKESIEGFVKKNKVTYIGALIVAIALFFLFLRFRADNLVAYCLWDMAFMAIIVFISFKIKIYNPIIYWFGKNLFPFFIFQRIPMMVITKLWPEFVNEYAYAFILICFVITLGITLLYKKATAHMPILGTPRKKASA
ncbi:MAG: acyltransferase family protein [Clostridia bacterium]|nr:acyltransferase family protein [Clostridia bacterium]